MKKRDNRAEISELAASEDGVFTSGQAARFGIPRYALSQSAKAGYIERVGHGAYRLTSAMDDGLEQPPRGSAFSDGTPRDGRRDVGQRHPGDET